MRLAALAVGFFPPPQAYLGQMEVPSRGVVHRSELEVEAQPIARKVGAPEPGPPLQTTSQEMHRWGAGWATASYAIVWSYFGLLVGGGVLSVLFCQAGCTEPRRAKRLSVLQGAFQEGGVQRGFHTGWISRFFLVFWVALPIAGNVLMALYTHADIDYGPNSDPMKLKEGGLWESVAEPFMTLFLLSGIVLFGLASFPDWAMRFMAECDLQDAEFVAVEQEGEPGEQPKVFHCRVRRTGGGPKFIHFACFRYVFDPKDQRFRPVGEAHRLTGAEVQQHLAERGRLERDAQEAHVEVGPNEVEVEVPSLPQSVLSEFMTRIYVFQIYCCWWCIFNHCVNIGAVWGSLVVLSGVARAYLLRRNQLKVQALAKFEAPVRVFRDSQLVVRSSEDLVPNDLILVEPNTTVPCDCVVASGGVVVDEAMLTGEPMPLLKSAARPDQDLKGSTLHGGTSVIEASSPIQPDGALCVVTAIGGATTRAGLIRLVLFPSEVRFQYTEDLPKVYQCLCCYAVALGVVLVIDATRQQPASIPQEAPAWLPAGALTLAAIAVKGIFSIIQCIHPLLPVSLVAGQSVGAERLAESGIACLAPARVPIAGCLDVCVFDKTGTITEDGMTLVQAQPVVGSALGEPSGDFAKSPLLPLLACCHKLSLVKGEVIGNHVDRAMLAAVGWRLDADNSVTDGKSRIKILRVIDFDHVRMTSGVVAQFEDGTTKVFFKGAAAKVAALGTSPPGFVQDADQWSAKSFYVLGVASKTLGGALGSGTPREDLEQNLTVDGLLLFKNEVKPDSKEALLELRGGGINCVMCTGDHLLTGVSVARQTELLPDKRVVRAKVAEGGRGVVWEELLTELQPAHSPRKARSIKAFPDFAAVVQSDPSIVMDLDAYRELKHDPLWPKMLPFCRVFARFDPAGKTSIIQDLQHLGHTVGMCGDGGNDCGALRAAHAGIALSSSESSIVAPFSSVNRSLLQVGTMVKEGRACLATNIACYSFFISYALALPLTKVFILFRSKVIMAEWQYLYFDCGICLLMPWAMVHCRPAVELADRPPNCSLFAPSVVLGAVGALGVYALFYAIAFGILVNQSWYLPWFPTWYNIPFQDMIHDADNFEASVTFLMICMHFATVCVVFSTGWLYRKPVWHNGRLLLAFGLAAGGLFALLFTERTSGGCLFRVNCDAATLNGGGLSWTGWLSGQASAECFNGPQMVQWLDNAPDAQKTHTHLQELVEDGARAGTCVPEAAKLDAVNASADLRTASAFHNVLPMSFRWILVALMLGYAVVQQALYALVLRLSSR